MEKRKKLASWKNIFKWLFMSKLFIEDTYLEKESAAEVQLVVDYGRKIGYIKALKREIDRCKFSRVSKKITPQRFPLSGKFNNKLITQNARVFNFHKNISSEEVIAIMKKYSYRPANLLEIVTFVQQHPLTGEKMSLISLDSIFIDKYGYRLVPIIRRGPDYYNLELFHLDGCWIKSDTFLGIRNR